MVLKSGLLSKNSVQAGFLQKTCGFKYWNKKRHEDVADINLIN